MTGAEVLVDSQGEAQSGRPGLSLVFLNVAWEHGERFSGAHDGRRNRQGYHHLLGRFR